MVFPVSMGLAIQSPWQPWRYPGSNSVDPSPSLYSVHGPVYNLMDYKVLYCTYIYWNASFNKIQNTSSLVRYTAYCRRIYRVRCHTRRQEDECSSCNHISETCWCESIL